MHDLSSTPGSTLRLLLPTLLCGLALLRPVQAEFSYQVEPLPDANNERLFGHAAVSLGDQTWIFAGNHVRPPMVVDEQTFAVTSPGEALPALHRGQAAAIDAHRILLVNSEIDGLYDTRDHSFTPLEQTFSQGLAVVDFQLTTMPDGTLVVSGGHHRSATPLSEVHRFDPEQNRWQKVGDLATARGLHSAIAVAPTTLMVVGGVGDNRRQGLDSIEFFDIGEGRSTGQISMAQPRAEPGLYLLDDQVLIAGGYTPKVMMNPVDSTMLLNLGNLSLQQGPRMSIPRYRPQLAPLPSGRLAIIGGAPDARVIDLFDPDLREIIPAHTLLPLPRSSGFTTTALLDGSVLIAGGRPKILRQGSPAPLLDRLTEELQPPPELPSQHPLERFITQLGARDFFKRDGAMHRLNADTADVIHLLKKHRNHPVLEIRMRVHELLSSATHNPSAAPWSILFLRHGEVVSTVRRATMLTGVSSRDLNHWQEEVNQLEIDAIRLIFPPDSQPHLRGNLLNQIGALSVPDIRIQP